MPMLSRTRTRSRRRGIVLLAVLVVVVVLSLAAYQYSEWMNAEYQASDAYVRMAQAKALAESGVHYTAAMLGSPTALSDTLNGNPWDNSAAFQNVVVRDDGDGRQGVFSIVGLSSPDDPDQTGTPYHFGVIDEAGKINLNALLALDGGTGDKAHQILMKLPNMTDDVANSILDWLDPTSDTPRTDGAKDDYYSALSPPYHCKNGPLDSLEELLLVKGVTPQLLFGNDINRNGVLDPDEDDGSGQVDLGWAAYLTVYSREPNTSAAGAGRIYLNDPDLNNLTTNLSPVLGDPLTNYIIAYRLYGPASTPPTPPGVTPPANPPYQPLGDSDSDDVKKQVQTAKTSTNQQSLKQIGTLWDLIGSKVSVQVGNGPNAKTIAWPSPLNDPAQRGQLLPPLLDQTTTTQNTDLTPKVNINTASETVLEALAAALQGSTSLDDADIQAILSARPDPSSDQAPAAIFQTPAWLLTEANLSVDKVKAIAPYITARSQVYRFQSVGYFQGGGPTARVEAVVDTNNGRPRIVYQRDLGTLGPGFDLSQMMGRP